MAGAATPAWETCCSSRPTNRSRILSPQGEQLSLQCEINAGKWRELSDLPTGKLDRRQLDASLNVRDGFIVEGMARLAGEVACPGFGSIVLIESLGISMLGQLVRYLRRSGEAPAASHGITPAQLRRIDEFIEEAPESWYPSYRSPASAG